MKRIIRLLLAAVTMLTMSPSLHGAAPRISLLTCSEGREIYELEGHTALRIVDPALGDFTVNWGVFDFDSPNFVYRFVKGETDYMAAGCLTQAFVNSYRRHGRSVRELVLNLDSVQSGKLVDMVLTNLQPQNRVYRYNYVLDNCATRPLEMLEAALGDTLTLAHSSMTGSGPVTFRNVMRHYHRNYPWYQFGIDTALGSGIDKPISDRAVAFAPVELERMVEGSRLHSGEPFVIADGYMTGGPSSPSATLGPTPVWLTPMAAALVVLLIAILVSIRQVRGKKRAAGWFDTIYFGIIAIEGCVLTFLIFVSVHEATSPNWLYLWLNPLALAGAVAPHLKNPRGLEIIYQSVNFALLIALSVIFMTGVQSPNPAFIPLMTASALRSVINIYCYACPDTKTPHSTTAC